MTGQNAFTRALAEIPRVSLGTLPTPLQMGPELPGGAQLVVKRDDLSGLGMGGNKVRKLEYLCAHARSRQADVIVTVGASQSNHARLAAAAGAVLGIPTHLVLGGEKPSEPHGNQLLELLFGATLHFPGTDDWDDLEAHMYELCNQLARKGRTPYPIPIGGSTATGALGFVAGWLELVSQCVHASIYPRTIIHASSSGGTQAGLLAGQLACDQGGLASTEIVAIGVAKQRGDLAAQVAHLADETLDILGIDAGISESDVMVDGRWKGDAYASPTEEADDAIAWAASKAALVLDRVYTGKAFAGLLGAAREGRWTRGDTVVFWHTGGHPAVFTPGGAPESRICHMLTSRSE